MINRGPQTTAIGDWTDTLYLSRDALLSTAEDVQLGQFAHSGVLADDETYQRQASVDLPARQEGDFHLFVVTDSGNALWEHNTEANNVRMLADAIHVLDPAADFDVTLFDAPPTAVAGGLLPVNWLVANAGDAAAPPDWTDAIYLSADAVLDPATDRLLYEFEHTVPLTAAGSYGPAGGGPAHVALPDRIEGTFHLFYLTDKDQSVYEKGRYDNNVSSRTLQVTDYVPDLQIVSASGPTTGVAGQFINVQFRIANQGEEPATGSWRDGFYLSADDQLDPAVDSLFAAVPHTGPLAVGGQYGPAGGTAIRLPARADGDYWISW